ncbi:universal stress protein [Pyxidicoccus fallax]|uniref:Universal stress protein n=1 Tax=Pyxidicoccus fallax TaxID=394095 RepID=A0A848LK29_9BACT|nr:universal stress protein [Pyxidicoccus fallax]NMO18079.1 universal stress protein [Pyxidicoccus fallax]NPC78585.1 universal stress protein [Pyxidicoccus fallax]
MSIVCATNFSDAALSASTIAAMLAKKAGETLRLVHVLNPDSARAFGASLRGAAEAALDDQVKRLEKLGAKVERALLVGEPAVAVQEYVREQRASLVVTSAPSHDAPFLGVGGTVDRLAQTLLVPLLVVREPGPLEAWARGERPLKVLLGVDRSLPFEAARDWVRGLRKWGAVELVGGRVYWPEEEYQRLGLAHPLVFADVTPDLRLALEKETAALMAPLATAEGQVPRTVLEAGVGRIADHLVELATREKADVLVVGTHHRRALGRLWSVSHHVLRLAHNMSVACVPSQAAVSVAEAPLPTFREVMVATDFSDTGNRAVAHAFGLVPPGGTVHLVHVAEGTRTAGREAELRQQLQAVVPRQAEATGRNVRVEVLMDGGRDVVTHLVQAAERLCVDAIVMGTHGRSGLKLAVLGSVAQALLTRTDRPVLLVRPLKG